MPLRAGIGMPAYGKFGSTESMHNNGRKVIAHGFSRINTDLC